MKTIFVVGARGIPDAEGGVEKNAEKLFPRMAERGWHVILAGLNSHIHSDHYRGVNLLTLPAVRFLKTDKIAYYILAFFHAVRIRPDIVHLAGLGSALMLWAYRLIGCKTVVRYGSADYLVAKWGFWGRFGFLFAEYQLRTANAIIAVTPALVSRLNARGIVSNIHMIPNAVDDEADFTDASEIELPSNYILTVGRVTAQKNYHNLIAGFRSFSRMEKGLKLVIVGGLDDRAYLSEMADHLTDDIILTGKLNRNTLGSIYRNAHLYVCSSMHEGNSNAVLEAISLHCPLLLSDIPENRDLTLNPKHYFDPSSPEAIHQALANCLIRREEYIVNCSGFPDWNQITDRTECVYKSLFSPEPLKKKP